MRRPLLIAHRGLLHGPNLDLENRPDTIEHARNSGYDVELDLWYHSGEFKLGHDSPVHTVSTRWLEKINRDGYLDQHHAWIHAKNIEALHALRKMGWEGHLFFHNTDDAVITNTGYIWTYPGKTLTDLSICVMPEWNGLVEAASELRVHGFCTDYVKELEARLN